MNNIAGKCGDIKEIVKLINERFYRENCNCYMTPYQFNEARRKYLRFMLGKYNPKRRKT